MPVLRPTAAALNGSAPLRRHGHHVATVAAAGDWTLAHVNYRRLAASVIQRAIRDLVSPDCPRPDRESAQAFLTGSDLLSHWCSLAGLDCRRVTAWARTQALPFPRK